MAIKKSSKTTSLIKWDEELAKQAEIAAGMEASTAGGQFFGLKNGILTWQDVPLPGNQMAVIILDSILENVYYKDRYDSDLLQSPTCFAFGRDEKLMTPHKVVVEAGEARHDQCNGCPMNEFGTSDVGKGKACRNTRRLAAIPAGTFSPTGKFELIEDEEHFTTTTIGFMKLPVTSVKGYANFVKQVANAFKRPPFGIVTKILVVPDPKNQFRVLFEPIMKLPDELVGVAMQRHEEIRAIIDFPYAPNEDQPTPVQKRGRSPGRVAQKPAAKTRGRKY